MVHSAVHRVSDDDGLHAVLETAGPGDVIRLAAGVYRQPLIIHRGGRPGQPLRLEAEVAGTAIFTGADPQTGWIPRKAGRWSLPFQPSIPSHLHEQFLHLAHPIQVWIGDRRLALVATPEDLRSGTFAWDGKEIWVQPGGQIDPQDEAIEVSIRNRMLSVEASWVEIAGLVITRCATHPQSAGAVIPADDVRVENCLFSESAGGAGVRFEGHRVEAIGNQIHHNGQIGFVWTGSDGRFANNTVHHNDLRGFCHGPLIDWQVWECGGGKVAFSRRSVFEGNLFSDHPSGPGLWLDIDNYHNRIQDNLFLRHGLAAIMVEISWDNEIARNLILDSTEANYGSTAILVQLSSRTVIHHNLILRSEGFGVHLRWHARKRDIHPYDPMDPVEFQKAHGFAQESWMPADGNYPLQENNVHHNVFVNCRRGAIRIDPHPLHARNNLSDHNFFWNACNLHPMEGGHRLQEWQAMCGLDLNSHGDKLQHFGPLLTEDLLPHPEGPLTGLPDIGPWIGGDHPFFPFLARADTLSPST